MFPYKNVIPRGLASESNTLVPISAIRFGRATVPCLSVMKLTALRVGVGAVMGEEVVLLQQIRGVLNFGPYIP